MVESKDSETSTNPATEMAAPHELASHSAAADTDAALEQEFRSLADQWLADTAFLSAPADKFLHPCYLGIIGIGKPAVPLLLREVRELSGNWFLALRAITKDDPVQPEDAHSMRRMADAWLRWGRRQGYGF